MTGKLHFYIIPSLKAERTDGERKGTKTKRTGKLTRDQGRWTRFTMDSQSLTKQPGKHLTETQSRLSGEWRKRLFAYPVGLKASGQELRAYRQEKQQWGLCWGIKEEAWGKQIFNKTLLLVEKPLLANPAFYSQISAAGSFRNELGQQRKH